MTTVSSNWNVVLTSAGRRGYLVSYFKSALGETGNVITTNSTKDAPAMVRADIACVVPQASSEEFVDVLVDICKRHSAKLLFSLHDWEAPFIAPNRERFLAVGCFPVVSNTDIIELCLDKYATYVYVTKCGLYSPWTCTDLAEARLAVGSGKLTFPLILKPRCGQGSLFLEVAHSLEELDLLWQLLRYKTARVESNGFLADGRGSLLIQEMIKGVEFDVEVVNDLEGNYVSTLSKVKLAARNGECEIAQTVEDPRLERLGRTISSALRHIGVLDIDLIEKDGVLYILEFNPRFGGCYPFSHAAGANLPAAYIAWGRGVQPNASWLRIRPGVKTMKEITMMEGERQ